MRVGCRFQAHGVMCPGNSDRDLTPFNTFPGVASTLSGSIKVMVSIFSYRHIRTVGAISISSFHVGAVSPGFTW